MTLCRRGRSVLVLTLVFGVTVVSAISSQVRQATNSDGPPRSVGAAVRQSLRHALFAAADGRLDQFTCSGPVLKLGGAVSFSWIRAFIAPGSRRARDLFKAVAEAGSHG